MKLHILPLLLSLVGTAAAQGTPIGAVPPTHTIEYGCRRELQTINVWVPDEVDYPLRIVIRSSGGGFRDRPASPWLGGFGLNQLKFSDEAAISYIERGIPFFVIGFEGADEDAHPEDESLGLWEGPPSLTADPCTKTDYYQQALDAFVALRAFCVSEFGSLPKYTAWAGNSAGSMQAFQIAAVMPGAIDAIVAGNSPLTWLGLLQADQPTELSFLRKSINQVPQHGVPYDLLIEAALVDQAGASCWKAALQFPGDILWLTDFPSQVLFGQGGSRLRFPYDYSHEASPVIYNRLGDIHDASQAGSAYLRRKNLTDGYACELEDVRGFEPTTYDDNDLDVNHPGIRSEACQIGVVLPWLEKRLGL